MFALNLYNGVSIISGGYGVGAGGQQPPPPLKR